MSNENISKLPVPEQTVPVITREEWAALYGMLSNAQVPLKDAPQLLALRDKIAYYANSQT